MKPSACQYYKCILESCWTELNELSPGRSSPKYLHISLIWLLKCYKNTFLYSIFFYLKNYIHSYSIKKYFSFVRILSFKENIFIFNQNILVFKKFLYSNGFFFRIKNIFSFNRKKCVQWNIFIQWFSVVKSGLPFVSEIA